jgi:hypothetical protein
MKGHHEPIFFFFGVQTASDLETRDMSKDRPTQLFMGETSVNEILDGMDIRFEPELFLVNGDSIAVRSAKGDFFHFLVQRPEGEFGAVVSCNVPPLFWTLYFHIEHVERTMFRLRMEEHQVQLLEQVLKRKVKVEN